MKKSLLLILISLASVSSMMAYYTEREATKQDKLFFDSTGVTVKSYIKRSSICISYGFISPVSGKCVESKPGIAERSGLSVPAFLGFNAGFLMTCVRLAAWPLGQSHNVQRIGYVGPRLLAGSIVLIYSAVGLILCRQLKMRKKYQEEKELSDKQAQSI